MMQSSLLVFALILSISLVLFPASALATPLNAWELRCISEEETQNKVCSTELHARFSGNSFVFYFARGPVGPVPFVASSSNSDPRKMLVQVDDESAIEADNCEEGTCYFETKKSKKIIGLFRRGKTAKILILDAQNQELFNDSITLKGFTSAYRRYR